MAAANRPATVDVASSGAPAEPVSAGSADAVRALERGAQRFTLFAALRLLERAYAERPRLGESRRALDDAVRLQQPPHLAFAPSDVRSLRIDPERGRPVLEEFSFGLFGPNGALPVHLTEHAFERRYQFDDPTFSDFVNLFQHRLISLFYRAWADADPAVSFDRPASDRFRLYLGALIGLAPQAAQGRDGVSDLAKLSRAAEFGAHARSAAGLEGALAGYFGLPVTLCQFVGEWLQIPMEARCRLGERSESVCLGVGATIGESTWQCQHQFEIVLGPLTLEEFHRFLPAGPGFAELQDLVRLYTNDEWSWRLRLQLRATEVPRARLGGGTHLGGGEHLGWTSWMGGRPVTAEDVVLSPAAATT